MKNNEKDAVLCHCGYNPHNQYHPFEVNFGKYVPLSVCVIPSHLALGCVGHLGPLLCRCDAAGELPHPSCFVFMHYLLSYVVTIFCVLSVIIYVLSIYF